MKVWVDAQLPPAICGWLSRQFDLDAVAVRDLGLRDAEDQEIFDATREAGVTILTKDADFAALVTRLGPPPQVLWVTCGNTTNRGLRRFLSSTLAPALALTEAGEPLVRLAEAGEP